MQGGQLLLVVSSSGGSRTITEEVALTAGELIA